jgi:hypothetical protein
MNFSNISSKIVTFKFGKQLPLALLLAAYGLSGNLCAGAYPEYQQFVEKHSHRTINCAMCHSNENGPIGNEKGQISALSAEELVLLNQARGALEPGMEVKSPILNEFGNSIIKALGKKQFLQYRSEPEKLAEALGKKSDLDEDGISDGQEYLDGTDPLNKFHGEPFKLFFVNLDRYKTQVALTIVAVLTLNFGLLNLIKGITIYQVLKGHKN